MWLKRPKPKGIEFRAMTPEDLQILAKAAEERPEYVLFWMGMRERTRSQFEQVPKLRNQEDVFNYGLQCYGLARELSVLTRLIEMPVTAKKALIRAQEQHEQAQDQEKPWDAPEE